MGESALTGQLGAPLCGTPSCCVNASLPLVQRLLRGGPESALKGICGGEAGVPPGRLGHSQVVGVRTSPEI
eukprot:6991019-Alexandrium_andersonii.AAC.1